MNKIGHITNFGSVYLSNPYGFKDQNFFYNTAIELTTTLGAVKLMEELKKIEKKVHKNKLFTNGPRRIDLDIIFYNQDIINLTSPNLTIPHPHALTRDFVLIPAVEIAADWQLPDGTHLKSLVHQCVSHQLNRILA